MEDKLKIGTYEFESRLIVGTGKYRTNLEMVEALRTSGAELITVALGRVNLDDPAEKTILDFLQEDNYLILPNTAGAYTVKDAVRISRLARELGLGNLVKVEVIGDKKTLLPDLEATLEATRILVDEGFTVMPYMTDDLIYAKKLEEAGAACVMPLASPIGSGLGVQNPLNIQFIKEAVNVPVIVDAGVGTASDAAVCMELGVDGVLMNTGIAGAKNPVMMADAMKQAVEAGRKAFLSGRIPKRQYAVASSPQEGFVLVES